MSVDLLMSFAYHRTAKYDEIRDALGPDQRLMIDSGAFTAFTQGAEIKRGDYAAFLTSWAGTYDYAITLDVIGDAKGTRENLLWLRDKGLPVLPVYTANAPESELRWLCERFDYVCYGGMVGVTKTIQASATEHIVRIADEYGTKIHALGQTSVPVLRTIRPYSVDSSRASTAPLSNTIPLYDRRSHRIRAVRLDGNELTAADVALMRDYDLDPRRCFDADKWKTANRKKIMRAAFLAIAALGVDARNGSDRPVVYSAFTSGDLDAILRAARDWREGNVSPKLRNVMEVV